MRVAIVDDEAEMREQIASYVRRFSEEEGVELEAVLYPSGNALLERLRAGEQAEIMIFDIDMPGLNGMDTARKLRETDQETVILFITNIAQYAINGYEVDAVDYIIKPVGYYDFSMKFHKAVRRARQAERNTLLLQTTEGLVRLDTDEVLYIEVSAHYLIYHLQDREYRVRGSMTEYEAEMRSRHFSRVQRSFLVNLKRVEMIQSGGVTVGGQYFSFGRAYKDAFLNEYMQYFGG